MKYIAVAALVCSIAASHTWADPESHPPALPQIPQKIFRMTDFGAKSDPVTDNAKSLQAAIDAASAAGGGVVEVSAGDYLCGPVIFASSINLKLDEGATLRMLPYEKYPAATTNPKAFISGFQLHDVAITGSGTIEGQGSPWWPLAKKNPGVRRPRMIALSGCERVLIESVKLQNSPMFHIAISGQSSDITVRGVTIRAPSSTDPVNPSHNTDACDVSAKHVLIENCDVSVGDDNFTCGGGTSDVLITHCKYGFGHGLSIGSPTAGGVTNFTVDDCTFTNTEAGIRIKSDRDRGGEVHNLTYRNLHMTNVGIPILIYASYRAPDRVYRDLQNVTAAIVHTYPSAPVTDRTPLYHDIQFLNITATVAPGNRAGLIWGLPEAPVENVLFQNVNIVADKPFGIFAAKNVKLEKCKIVTPSGQTNIALDAAK